MEVKIVGLGDRGKILNTSFIPINKILNFQENCRMVGKYLLICGLTSISGLGRI